MNARQTMRPTGHRYHVVDGLGGQWLCETTDEYPEPTPIGLVNDILSAAEPSTLTTGWGPDSPSTSPGDSA